MSEKRYTEGDAQAELDPYRKQEESLRKKIEQVKDEWRGKATGIGWPNLAPPIDNRDRQIRQLEGSLEACREARHRLAKALNEKETYSGGVTEHRIVLNGVCLEPLALKHDRVEDAGVTVNVQGIPNYSLLPRLLIVHEGEGNLNYALCGVMIWQGIHLTQGGPIPLDMYKLDTWQNDPKRFAQVMAAPKDPQHILNPGVYFTLQVTLTKRCQVRATVFCEKV